MSSTTRPSASKAGKKSKAAIKSFSKRLRDILKLVSARGNTEEKRINLQTRMVAIVQSGNPVPASLTKEYNELVGDSTKNEFTKLASTVSSRLTKSQIEAVEHFSKVCESVCIESEPIFVDSDESDGEEFVNMQQIIKIKKEKN